LTKTPNIFQTKPVYSEASNNERLINDYA